MRVAPLLMFAVLPISVGCALSHERASGATEPEVASSASLAIDESSLYWTDPGRGAVVRAPRGGGALTVLAPASPALYGSVALTPRDLVWVDDGDGVDVWRVPLRGGDRVLVGEGGGGPIGVAADAEHAYFSRGDADFDLIEVDLSTGAERVVAMAVPALGLLIDGDDLIGTSCSPDGVWRIERTGGRPSAITGAYCPITLALHDGDIFFEDYAEPTNPGVGGSGIFRAPSTGGVAIRVTRSEGIAFAVHRGLVYTALGGALIQVARDGTSVEIAPAVDVHGVAVDDDFVYWTTPAPDGSLELELAPLP